MSQDLKIAKAFVLPLGGKNAEETIKILKEFSFLVRKALSKKLRSNFCPKFFLQKMSHLNMQKKLKFNKTNKQIGK